MCAWCDSLLYADRKLGSPLPPIQGTNITLNTPEDIEKWIAERKSRWPTAKRVQEKVFSCSSIASWCNLLMPFRRRENDKQLLPVEKFLKNKEKAKVDATIQRV